MKDDIETLRENLAIVDRLQPETVRALCKKAISERNEADARIEQLGAERDSLQKALDDRFAADQKAAKAIFEAKMAEHQTFMDASSINVENDSLRAKLERAKEALEHLGSDLGPNDAGELNARKKLARTVLSELSADAPAQLIPEDELAQIERDRERER